MRYIAVAVGAVAAWEVLKYLWFYISQMLYM